ncbi:MAG: tetratricopeptide repeat protein [Gemmataceae bacterium]|nr:tetratricopeptide repeat protein [Gemmataceae bacterium]
MDPSAARVGDATPPSQRVWGRRRLVAGVVCAALVALVGYFIWKGQHNANLRDHALRAHLDGPFEKAEPLLKRASAALPDDVLLLKALSLGYIEESKLDDAVVYLNRWCAVEPDEAEPLRLRLELYSYIRKKDAAIADGLRLCERDPGNVKMCVRVTDLLYDVGRVADAETLLRRCLQSNRGDPGLRFLLAKACHVQGRTPEAQQLTDALVAEHPGYADGLALKAILYREANQPALAVTLLEKALTLKPDYFQARYHLSLALASVGKTKEAEREMAEVNRHRLSQELLRDSRMLPENLDLQVRAAEALLEVGATDKAVGVLEPAVKRFATAKSVHRLLATCYERQGKIALAEQHRRLGQ